MIKNIVMNHKELVDQFSSNIFKENRKIENVKSWMVMRNYLEQLDDIQYIIKNYSSIIYLRRI